MHSLFPAGRAFLDRWPPGLSAELVSGGAGLAKHHNSEIFYNGRRKVAIPGVELVMSTRPFQESVLRRHVLATPNVTVRRARVTGLEVSGEAVIGVRYAAEDGEGRLASDFVVDAMARSGRLSRWLTDVGWPAPTLERVRVDINYSTALFARPEPEGEGLRGIRQSDAAASASARLDIRVSDRQTPQGRNRSAKSLAAKLGTVQSNWPRSGAPSIHIVSAGLPTLGKRSRTSPITTSADDR